MTFRKGMSKPDGSGRKPGQQNKITEEVRKLAQKHSKDVIAQLYELAMNAQDERARVAASKELLDRAAGKSTNLFGGDAGAAPIKVVIVGDDAKL